MPKKEEYFTYIKTITQIFMEKWNAAWTALPAVKGIDKCSLLEFMPAIYRRWYFSALVEDSSLSPANIVYALNKAYNMPVLATPRLSFKPGKSDKPGQKGDKNPVFELTLFPAEEHPFIKDLQLFLKHFEDIGPAFDLSALGAGPEGLNLKDPEYIGFLCDIAISLRLVKKMPSVNTVVGMVNSTWQSFFKQSPLIILEKAASAVIDMCTEALGEVLPLNSTFRQKMSSYLKNPKSVDEIFGDMFTDSGIDILKMFDELDSGLGIYEDMLQDSLFDEPDNLDDLLDMEKAIKGKDFSTMHADIMTGAFFLGISLDKFFLTPLSYYLRLIQPLYILPYDPAEELKGLYDLLKGDRGVDPDHFAEEISFVLYAPCTLFALTCLGETVSGTAAKNASSVFLPPDVPIAQLILSLKDLAFNLPPPEIHSMMLKLSLKGQKGLWQNAEINRNTSLDSLHRFICIAFGLDPEVNYSFYLGGSENPFAEYTNRPLGRSKKDRTRAGSRSFAKNPLRSPKEVRLSDLAKDPGDKLLYIFHNPHGRLSFNITLMKFQQKSGKSLPRIIRRGNGFTEV